MDQWPLLAIGSAQAGSVEMDELMAEDIGQGPSPFLATVLVTCAHCLGYQPQPEGTGNASLQ